VQDVGRKKNSDDNIDPEREPARADILEDLKFFQVAHSGIWLNWNRAELAAS
jgi:hypothetical protein